MCIRDRPERFLPVHFTSARRVRRAPKKSIGGLLDRIPEPQTYIQPQHGCTHKFQTSTARTFWKNKSGEHFCTPLFAGLFVHIETLFETVNTCLLYTSFPSFTGLTFTIDSTTPFCYYSNTRMVKLTKHSMKQGGISLFQLWFSPVKTGFLPFFGCKYPFWYSISL